MADGIELSCSRTYPMTVEQAFDAVLPLALDQLFDRRYGPIPAVRGVEGPTPWGQVGQARTVRLAGGGSMLDA